MPGVLKAAPLRGAASAPRTCDLSPRLKARFGARAIRPWPGSGKSAGIPEGQRRRPKVPAVGDWAGGESCRWWAAARPAALALGRTARAAAAAPFPRTRHRHGHPPSRNPVPALARTTRASSPRRAILPPGKLAVKGATCGRVPPLHFGQTLDCELSRQGQRLSGGRARTGSAGGMQSATSVTRAPARTHRPAMAVRPRSSARTRRLRLPRKIIPSRAWRRPRVPGRGRAGR